MNEPLYCGCCGHQIGHSTRSDPDWCSRCLPHISSRLDISGHLAPPWDRTYFATAKQDCPFQASGAETLGEKGEKP